MGLKLWEPFRGFSAMKRKDSSTHLSCIDSFDLERSRMGWHRAIRSSFPVRNTGVKEVMGSEPGASSPVSSHEHRFADDVSFNRGIECLAPGPRRQFQLDVKRIQLEVVTVHP